MSCERGDVLAVLRNHSEQTDAWIDQPCEAAHIADFVVKDVVRSDDQQTDENGDGESREVDDPTVGRYGLGRAGGALKNASVRNEPRFGDGVFCALL